MRLPELGVRNVNDAAPKLRFGEVFLPNTEMLAVKRCKLRRHPSLGMNTVRDASDWHFVDGDARPHIFPKRSSHFAVQFTDAIRVAAEAQRENGHTEWLALIQSCVAE